MVLIECLTHQEISNSSSSDTKTFSTSLSIPTMVTITGKITGVMETWPLQLTLDVESEQYYVSLKDNTDIHRGSEPATTGELSPDMQVKITGITSESETRLIAQSIEVL